MASIRQLIHEAHRRSLWQVLGVYAVASWVIWQVIGSLYEWIGLPAWVPGAALVLLLVGLPIVLATAFVQEGAPGLGGVESDAKGPAPAASSTEPAVSDHAASAEGSPAAEGVAGDEPAPPPTTSPTPTTKPPASSLFTWSKAITGGVLAFAALGLAAAGFMGMRALGIGPAATLISSGELEAREPIVLADFGSPTGDTALADVVTEALRIDLSQSDVLRVLERERVHYILERMGRTDVERLTPAVAREVAIRGGHKASIEGEVGSAGAGYVLTARIVAADSGVALASFRETARDSTAVIDAIDRLGESLREKVGESLRSVRASPSLAMITTSSLEALEKWDRSFAAQNAGELERAVELLDEAIALDSTFAMAHRKKGAVLNNLGRRAEAVEALRKAAEHADRLTDGERYYAEGIYYYQIGQMERALRSYQAFREQGEVPRIIGANNTALVHLALGDFEAAERTLRVMIDADTARSSVFAPGYWTTTRVRLDQGRSLEGWNPIEVLAERVPDNVWLPYYRARLAAYRGEYDEARRHLERMADEQSTRIGWQVRASRSRAALDALEGRVGDALRGLHRARRLNVERRYLDDVLLYGARAAVLEAHVLGDTAAARSTLADARAEAPPDSVPAEDIPYASLARAYAAAGLPDSARSMLRAFETRPADWLDDWLPDARDAMEAFIASAEGRHADAAVSFRRAAEASPWCPGCYLAELGLAWDAAGRPDSALVAYERYLETPWATRTGIGGTYGDNYFLATVHERMGALHEMSGADTAAAPHYARFIDLWEDADPELQPRVDAARRALERLAAEGSGSSP